MLLDKDILRQYKTSKDLSREQSTFQFASHSGTGCVDLLQSDRPSAILHVGVMYDSINCAA